MGTSDTDTNLEANKALVEKFWQAFSKSEFTQALELMHDEGSWWVSGTTSISGTYTKEEFRELASGVAGGTKKGVTVTNTGITAEGNRVAMEAVSDGETQDGKRYNNKYHFLHEVRDGKLFAVREYMDPEHVREVFGD